MWAKALVNTQKCLGLKDIFKFYNAKNTTWSKKWEEMALEADQYDKLLEAKKGMEDRVTKIFADLDLKTDDQWKSADCKGLYTGFKTE